MNDEIGFEQARKQFLAALSGGSSGPPEFEPHFPSAEVLKRLSDVNEPMDDAALAVVREEIVDEVFTDSDPSMIFKRFTWAEAILLIQEYRRRDKNYSEWRCPSCRRERFETSEGVLLCECGAEMERIQP